MAIDTRLLTVIRSINELGICSVLDLHRATGISRPAVHRMVQCLCMNGYVEKVPSSSSVRLTPQILTLSSGYRPENKYTAAAAPVLAMLQAKVRWPHSFATPDDDQMVIQETTRARNPFVFDNGRTGLRLPMATTALGCAYLAHCDLPTRLAALDRLVHSNDNRSHGDEMLALARHRISQASERGAAVRSGGMSERTSTVAVPVFIGEVAIGALCTTFPTTAVSTEEIYSRLVPTLQETSRDITLRLEMT